MSNDLIALAKKYIGVCNIERNCFTLRAKKELLERFENAGIDYRTVKAFCTKESSEEDFKRLLESKNSLYEMNKELCLDYLTFLKETSKASEAKVQAKSILGQKMSAIDPMFIEFLLYKLCCAKAKKKLQSKLVNLSVQDLEERFKDVINELDI